MARALAIAAPASAASGAVSAAIEPQGYARIVFDFDRLPKAATAKLVDQRAGGRLRRARRSLDSRTRARARGAGRGDPARPGRDRDPDVAEKPVKLVTRPWPARSCSSICCRRAGPVCRRRCRPASSRSSRLRPARRAQLKAEEARLRARPQARLRVDGATHPTFRRLVFGLGGDAPVDWRRDGPRVAVDDLRPLRLRRRRGARAAAARLRGARRRPQRRPAGDPGAGPRRGAVRGFREDGDFILDIDREAAARRPSMAKRRPAPVLPSPLRGGVGRWRVAQNMAPTAKQLDAQRPRRSPEPPPPLPSPQGEGVATTRLPRKPRMLTRRPTPTNRPTEPARAMRRLRGNRRPRPSRLPQARPSIRRAGRHVAAGLSVRAPDAGRRVPARRNALGGVRRRARPQARRAREGFWRRDHGRGGDRARSRPGGAAYLGRPTAGLGRGRRVRLDRFARRGRAEIERRGGVLRPASTGRAAPLSRPTRPASARSGR